MASGYRKRGKIQLDSVERVTGNLDLMNEIFMRLSFKSSIRCMLVCKDWYGLIKNMHSLRSGQLSGLFYHIPSLPVGRYQYIPLLDGEDDSAYRVNLSLHSNFEHSRILQSCNGFLLLYNSFPLRRYFVYNSATRVHRVLPKLCKDYLLSISLAFDGSCQYKVVALVRLSGGSCQIQIYSSGGSGIWRTASDCAIEIDSNVKFLDGLFWNDSIIWVNCHSNMPSLLFNLCTEKLMTMASPPIQYPYKKDTIYLKESQGHLYFIEFDCYFNFREFHVYELEKNHLQWFLKYRIDLSDFCGAATTQIWDEEENFPFVLSLIHGDVEENSALVLYTPGQIISYNLKDKTPRKLCDFNVNVHQFKYFRYWGHRCIYHHVMPVRFIHSS